MQAFMLRGVVCMRLETTMMTNTDQQLGDVVVRVFNAWEAKR